METPRHLGYFTKTIGCSPQAVGKILSLKTTLTNLIEHKEFELVPNQRFYPYWLVFMVLEGTVHITRGEKLHQLTNNRLIYNGDLLVDKVV